MSRRLHRVGLSLVGFLSLWGGVGLAQSWPVHQFEVVNVEPSGLTEGSRNIHRLATTVARLLRETGVDPDFPGVFETVPLSDTTRSEIESLLNGSAATLAAWGFPAPSLEPVVERQDGTSAYRVYLVSGLQEASGSYHPSVCDAVFRRERVILLDADDILRDGRLWEWGAATVAHELFHAVQYSLPFYQDCTSGPVGDWMVEGQAEAVGNDLARLLVGASLRSDPMEAVGVRSYSDRLPVPDIGEIQLQAYRTSSFWRFPALGGGEVNYSYLVPVLNRTASARDCVTPGAACDAELEAVDAGLKESLGMRLRDLYARFIQAYASYGPQHFVSLGGEAITWEGNTFDSACTLIELRPDALQRSEVARRFEDLSAQCWEVDVAGFDTETVPVRVTALGPPTVRQLEQLTAIRAGDSPRLDTADVQQALPGDTPRATWTYTLPNDAKTLILLTNVAHHPEATTPLPSLEVTFTAVRESVSMADRSASPQDLPDTLPLELDTFVGQVLSVFDLDICNFTLRAHNQAWDAVELEMDHLGPIGPGTYPMSANDHPAYLPREDAPKGTFVGGFALGAGNPMSGGTKQAFWWQSGTVTITSVADGFIQGEVRGMGWRDEPYGMASFSVIARFAFTNRAPMRTGERCLDEG